MESILKLATRVFRKLARTSARLFGPGIINSIVLNLAQSNGMEPSWSVNWFTRAMLGLDPLDAALQTIGIGNYDDGYLTGENHLINFGLRDYITSETPVFVDVGANIGAYARKLRTRFPRATIYAFEPNPETYQQLQRNTASLDIQCLRMACGAATGSQHLFTYAGDLLSEHASTRSDVLRNLHGADQITSFEVSSTSLDEFCAERQIYHIDLLKIDTEGDELEVLKGASGLISAHKVTAIQFEFNEMNVISRVFLRDFFEILPGFDLYRLMPNGLLSLGEYSTQYEIFRYQNIFAVVRPGKTP